MDADRAEKPKRRRWLADVPAGLAMAGVAIGLGVIAVHHFRWGVGAIAVSLLGAALLRTVLPSWAAGLLVVRSRLVDVGILGGIGFTLLLLDLVTRT
ncbi:MAG: DUF3017 domain-containing protein [Acidothermus sp.]|nr:DUF3017 domain-containing protein [Acidothermus sp.]